MSEQGDTYTGFIDLELAREHDRRDKINAQSTAVVTGSGALFTLSVGIVAFLKGKEYLPKSHTLWLIVVALVLYLVSAILGLLAGVGRKYQAADNNTLNAMLLSRWADSEIAAKNNVSRLRIGSIISLRDGNNNKADLLLAATLVQVVAAAVLAVALYLAIRQ